MRLDLRYLAPPRPPTAPWIVVLAAGDGLRLRAVTTDGTGRAWPKQYCRFMGDHSLLRQALQRAKRQTDRSRIMVVVARDHEPWWRQELNDWPQENVIVQPANRGTAAGILLPLLQILERDPRATVGFLPSDHHVEQEEPLAQAMQLALATARRDPTRLVLLGVEPERAECGYGWILPDSAPGAALSAVAQFVEKPPPAEAEALMTAGGLWNSFLFAASAARLLELYGEHQAELALALIGAGRAGRWSTERLREFYQTLPSLDFSRDLLERSPDALAVLRVPACGWTDLGTPERARYCRDARAALIPWSRAIVSADTCVDIAWAC